MGRNLSNLYISQSFEYLVQISGSEFETGLGSTITSVNITASNAVSASHAITASYALNAGTTVSTASLLTTASATNNVITFTKGDASTFAITVATGSAVTVNTGSLLVTASITNATTTFTKGDGSTFSLTANNVVNATSSSYSVTADTATSASFATSAATATSASFASFAISSSNSATSISSSYSSVALSSSFATSAQTATSASFATNAATATSASFATTAATASYYNEADTLQTVTTRGNSTSTSISASGFYTTGTITTQNAVVLGTASIAFLDVTYQSSSVIYSSGSNQFGDASNDVQTLFGTVDVKTGPLKVTGSANFQGGLTGSLLGTASYATNALSASYAPSTPAFPYTGSAEISGSLRIKGTIITGEYGNTATGVSSAVIGGGASGVNTVTGQDSVIAGGHINTININNSFVGGGRNCRILGGDRSGIVGGFDNLISNGDAPFIGGGGANLITGNYGGILAGAANTLGGNYSALVGGNTNTIGAYTNTVIVGGTGITAANNNTVYVPNLVVTGSAVTSSITNVIGNWTDTYTSSPKIANIVTLTQAEYNAISSSADPNTFYVISDSTAFNPSAYATTGSNTFNGNQIISGSLSVTSGITGSMFGTASFATFALGAGAANSATSASYALIADTAISASFATTALTASFYGGTVTSASYAVTGGGLIAGAATAIRSAPYLTSTAATASGANSIALGSGAYTLGGGTVAIGTATQAQALRSVAIGNTALASGANSVAIGYNITSSASNGVNINGAFIYDGAIKLPYATQITGSLRGQVTALTITANTASLNCATNNFFTLTLVSGSNTFINPSNIQPGQTINLQVTQANPGNGTISFPTSVKQVSGSSYVPSTGAGPVDIVTFISFDASSLYLSNVKNLV